MSTLIPSTDSVSSQVLMQALDGCAREPIHIPGSIQPSGILLAVSPQDGLIRMVSANLDSLFPDQTTPCLGQPLANLLGLAQAQSLLQADIGDWRQSTIQALTLTINGHQETHDALIYLANELRVIEIELQVANNNNLFHDLFIPLRDAMWRLDAENSMQRYCQAMVEQVRLLTGYDHVMMYRFEANWDGIVIAESLTEDSPPYLGNRFPASDIPPQARALYIKNLVRLLEDRDAPRVPIIPHLDPIDDQPLNLTYSTLRSMSPVHLEYLRNMGVRATLTISLLQNQRLWGLIACHHNTPKYVSLRERELDEFVGKTVSLKLSTLDSDERTEFNNRVRSLLDKISSEIRNSGRIDDVIDHNQVALLGLVRAQGAVVNIGGHWHTIGITPSIADLDALLLTLRARSDDKVFHTDNLASVHPAAAKYHDIASGVLIAALDASLLSFIIWFRPGILRTLNWAGQPDKIVMRDNDVPRISPRTSFATWAQTYRDKSAPWSQVEIDAANTLALAIIEVLSQRALASSEESYRLLAEHSTDLIAQLTPQGLCNFVSPACLDILGIPPRLMIGLPLENFTLEEDRALLAETLTNLDTQDTATVLLRFRRPEGALVWVEASLKRIEYLNAPDQIILNARDVTQRHLYQLAIEDLHRRNARIMDAAGEGLVSVKQNGVIIYVNEQAGRLFGCDPQSMLGKHCCQALTLVDERIDENQTDVEECELLETIQRSQTHQATAKTFRHHDGHLIRLDYVSTPVVENGQTQGCVIVFRETARSTTPVEAEGATEAILNATSEAVMITNAKGEITSVNRSFSEITGYSETEAIGQTPSLFKSGIHTQDFYKKMWQDLKHDHRWNGEIWNRRKNGEIYPQWGSITALTDPNGETRNYVAVFSDISKAKQAEEKLYHLANHDNLTGLPNRMLFSEQLGAALDRSKRRGRQLAVIFIDLDRFKIINDTLGHAVGDSFLRAIAKRLDNAKRKDEILARLGGDEFVLAVESPEDRASLEAMAQRLLTNLSRPIELNGHEFAPTASVGISLYPADGLLANDLIRAADTAMYRAKELGRNGIQFYSQQMAEAMTEKFSLSNELRRALRDNEFLLYYQPQVECLSGKLVGLEALMRWQHPQRGLVSPGDFIPIATELGLISDLGDWALEAACRQMRTWLDAGIDIPRVAVNVAPAQFNQSLVERVAKILASFNLTPNRLEIEITEGALERSEEVREVMMQLRGLGVELSVDDFGTGYSSLAHIKTFPVSCFKIDKSFVDHIPGNRQDEAIIRTIMALGDSLNIEVLAEGVETRAQYDFLKAAGVNVIQGYYFDRPLPAAQINTLLDYPLAKQ